MMTTARALDCSSASWPPQICQSFPRDSLELRCGSGWLGDFNKRLKPRHSDGPCFSSRSRLTLKKLQAPHVNRSRNLASCSLWRWPQHERKGRESEPGLAKVSVVSGNNRCLFGRRDRFDKRFVLARASSSSDATANPSVSPVESKPSTPSILDLPIGLWNRLSQPLSDFGFGKRSLWEGGVGLFVLTGAGMLILVLSWIKGVQLSSKTRRYEAIMEFAQACGIAVGTPVRIRGVDVGSVVGLRPSLERIDVVVEVKDCSIVIPKNSLVEVNQSGLISETLIDITPRHPIPQPQHNPMEEGCATEGVIVCHRDRIKGEQGVSLDELVGVCTKLAKQMDQSGIQTMFDAANRVSLAVEEAKPLIEKVNAMAGDVGPLLKELREGGLLDNLERLTRVATESAHDLRQLNSAVLTPENTELLRQSVSTLTKTLKHFESISNDVSGLTGDPQTRYNLKLLIESLSRLISD